MKITLKDLTNLQNENTAVSSINDNNTTIEVAFDNTLSRDGSLPNQMEAEIDMNSNRIINLSAAGSDTEPVRRKEFLDIVNSLQSGDGIVEGSITNNLLVDMPADTFKGRLDTSGEPQDITVSEAQEVLGITDLQDQVGNLAISLSVSVNTVADLQSLNVPASVNGVTTLGYYSKGDGGGTNYVRVSSEPTQPGYVQSADGAYWDLPDRTVINVLWLGAKADNSFDNTQAVKDSLNAIPTRGGTIYFPAAKESAGSNGIYLFTTHDPIYILDRRNIRITGEGNSDAVGLNNQPLLLYKPSSDVGSLISVDGGKGIEIDHLNIANYNTFTGILINLGQQVSTSALTSAIDIHHCSIFGWNGHTAVCLISLANALCINIRDSIITAAKTAILGPAQVNQAVNVVSIERNWFQLFDNGYAIRVSGQNWAIRDNVFEPVDGSNTTAGGITTSLSVNPPQGLIIENNNFTDASTDTGIWIDFSGCPVDSATIVGNFIWRGSAGIHLGTSADVTIMNNTIYTGESRKAISGTGTKITALSNRMKTPSGNNIGTLFNSIPTDNGSIVDNCDGTGVRVNQALLYHCFAAMPESDPHVAGQLWTNSGVVTVSAG